MSSQLNTDFSSKDFCQKISQIEYMKQSKDYTMEKLKELQSQLLNDDKNKKQKEYNNHTDDVFEVNCDVNSDVNSDDTDYDDNLDADCDTINININNLSKSNKFKSKSNSKKNTNDDKEIIILNLMKKLEQDVKRKKMYSNKIKQLNDEYNQIDAKLHYLKLDYNNLELVADSLKKEIKEKDTKIISYQNEYYKMKWEIVLLKMLVVFLFFTIIYIYFS